MDTHFESLDQIKASALDMQGVLGNLAAGLTIIFTEPFQAGDYISIANHARSAA